MKYIPQDQIEWKKVKYLKIPLDATDLEARWLYEFWLNEPLASWDVFSYWEVERVLSMQKELYKGDILFDIGTEQGWCNLAYAQIVGPENMVLIEPTPEFWPNIKTLWRKNFDKPAKGYYDGFFGDTTTDKRPGGAFMFWPKASQGDLIDRNSYKYIWQDRDIPQITLDDYVAKTGIIPAALTMDTEGAELLILKGAEKTLRENKIKIWVSEHDDLQKQHYNIEPDEIMLFLAKLGYSRQVLAEDHERHVFYKNR